MRVDGRFPSLGIRMRGASSSTNNKAKLRGVGRASRYKYNFTMVNLKAAKRTAPGIALFAGRYEFCGPGDTVLLRKTRKTHSPIEYGQYELLSYCDQQIGPF